MTRNGKEIGEKFVKEKNIILIEYQSVFIIKHLFISINTNFFSKYYTFPLDKYEISL